MPLEIAKTLKSHARKSVRTQANASETHKILKPHGGGNRSEKIKDYT